jgi:hypothetical protein
MLRVRLTMTSELKSAGNVYLSMGTFSAASSADRVIEDVGGSL